MSKDFYDVWVEDELRRIQIVNTQRAASPPPLPAKSTVKRSGRWIAMDCATVFLILLLAPSYFWSMPMFLTLAALLSAIVLTVYWKVTVWVLNAMGPPDHPHVIAIIKAPDRLYCPRCGAVRTEKHCSGCGANVEAEYRKVVRQLARYAVEDTEGQCNYLERALAQRIEEIAHEQSVQITMAMQSLERNYVMQIVRQAKQLREQEQRSLESPGESPFAAAGD